MSRRNSLQHVALHLSSAAFLAVFAWLAGFDHETAGAAIAVAAGIVAVGWAVLGTLWWLIQFLMRDRDS